MTILFFHLFYDLILFGLQVVARGSFKIGSVPPSILLSDLLSYLSKSFHGIVSLFFSKFWHGARIPWEVVCDRAGFLGKNFFAPKIGKMGQKQGFFNLLESFVINFYWIWSIMKIYIICCVPAQIPYLGKFLFLRYGPKCSQPIRLQDFLINHISRTNQWNLPVLNVDANSHKLKVDQKILSLYGQKWVWPA